MWFSLSGPHRGFAEGVDDLMWYPPSIAPFLAVPAPGVVPDLESARRRGLGDAAYFVGVSPNSLPEGWRIVSRSYILQLFPAGGAEPAEDAGTVLGESDRKAMRELTQIAFPDYFRERTSELGTYLGIYEGATLAAMAGERLALAGWREISAVCTHPDFAGRGYARRLTRALMLRHRMRGTASFLHVSEGNSAARGLYRSMGFTERARLELVKVERGDLGPLRPGAASSAGTVASRTSLS